MNRWPAGVVRHLQLDPDCPLGAAFAERQGVDLVYTLVIHPSHADQADVLRAKAEANPDVGNGLFGPERDL